MMEEKTLSLRVIAHAHTDFAEKFGIPRQSGLAKTLSRIVFTPSYRNPDALRGIEGFSHLWLIWHFSGNTPDAVFRPTVRPPRLGGNRAEGVFATRSPFRPNPIGLSSVRLLGTEQTEHDGIVLLVEGADLLDGTPIFDIKPYLPFTDSHPDALGGFADRTYGAKLSVDFPDTLLSLIPTAKRGSLFAVLSEDPRPAYQNDPERIYGFLFAGYEIRFRVEETRLFVVDVTKKD